MYFTKMQGAGNDYIYIDCTQEYIPNPPLTARMISDRHFGVGSDGLVMILAGDEEADFEMRMFNADGSEAGMCGNAARCVGKYVYERGMTDLTEIRLRTGSGIKLLKLILKDNIVKRVQVDMGIPGLKPEQIPTVLRSNAVFRMPDGTDTPAVIRQMIKIQREIYPATCVSMGNPHCVFFLENVEGWNVEKWGKLVENHEAFPERTNTEFACIEDRTHIRMRVWERGSGETMACGTGACATLVAAVLCGLTERKATLMLNGGELEIEWDEKTGHVWMTGPAEFVFDGEWPISGRRQKHFENA